MNLSLKQKIFGGIGILILLLILIGVPFGILLAQNKKLRDQNSQLAGQLDINHESLTKSLQRAETKVAETQEQLNDLAEANGLNIKQVREDLEKVGARIEAVATTTGKTTTIIKNYHSSPETTPSEIETPTCPEDGRPIDVHGYTKRVETTHIEDSNGMRIATSSFEAAREAPWRTKAYGIQYRINNVIGETPEGRTVLHTELQASSEAQPDQIFRIEGVESRVLQAPAEPTRFDWWDPSLFLMVSLGLVVYPEVGFSASPQLGLSIFSYGDWRFLGVAVGYDAYQNTFRASFIPFLYNLGSPLPLLTNLYLFLEVAADTDTNVSVSIGIATRL